MTYLIGHVTKLHMHDLISCHVVGHMTKLHVHNLISYHVIDCSNLTGGQGVFPQWSHRITSWDQSGGWVDAHRRFYRLAASPKGSSLGWFLRHKKKKKKKKTIL